jgi:hypothetical protein
MGSRDAETSETSNQNHKLKGPLLYLNGRGEKETGFYKLRTLQLPRSCVSIYCRAGITHPSMKHVSAFILANLEDLAKRLDVDHCGAELT